MKTTFQNGRVLLNKSEKEIQKELSSIRLMAFANTTAFMIFAPERYWKSFLIYKIRYLLTLPFKCSCKISSWLDNETLNWAFFLEFVIGNVIEEQVHHMGSTTPIKLNLLQFSCVGSSSITDNFSLHMFMTKRKHPTWIKLLQHIIKLHSLFFNFFFICLTTFSYISTVCLLV